MKCPNCASEIDDKAVICVKCGASISKDTTDSTTRLFLPVGRSGWAIAAGYLGLFSILGLPAPFALGCGIMAVRDIKRDPNKHGMGRAVFGIVAGGLITLLMIVGLIITLFD